MVLNAIFNTQVIDKLNNIILYRMHLAKESLNSDGQQFRQYQQNKESLNSNGQQFHQYQQNKESLNSDVLNAIFNTQVIVKLNNIILYRMHLAMSGVRTNNVSELVMI
jgi:DNA-binding TFAR19-related protein (PDSD5 family)